MVRTAAVTKIQTEAVFWLLGCIRHSATRDPGPDLIRVVVGLRARVWCVSSVWNGSGPRPDLASIYNKLNSASFFLLYATSCILIVL